MRRTFKATATALALALAWGAATGCSSRSHTAQNAADTALAAPADSSPSAATPAPPASAKITQAAFNEDSDGARVVLSASAPLLYTSYEPRPDLLIVDLRDASVAQGFTAPQASGSPSALATTNTPRGGRSSSSSIGMLCAGSKPASKRSDNSAKYCAMHHRAELLAGSTLSIFTPATRRRRCTSDIAATRLLRCESVRGDRMASAASSERRFISSNSVIPFRVSSARLTRSSSIAERSLTRRAVTSDWITRVRYPESSPSRARSSRRSAPRGPISNRTRDAPSGRLRPRKWSSRAPAR